MVCLIDVSGFIYRAFYGLPSLIYNGEEVGALYGFCSAMTKIVSMFHGAMFIAALDCSKKTFRNDMFSEYKANRKSMPETLVSQIPYIREACDRFGFYKSEKQGYEADDIIASYAKMITDQQVVIISSDKDLMQLMDDCIKIYDPMKRKYVSDDDVMKKFGVSSDKVLDVLSLIGDTSDNVPGVSGIGVKTASALINEYGSLDNLISNIDNLPKTKRNEVLKSEIDKAILSRNLINLKDDLELRYEFKVSVPDNLNEFLLKFGFKSLIKSEGKQNQFFDIEKDNDENPFPIIIKTLDDKKLTKLKSKLEDNEIQKLCDDSKLLYKKCFANNIALKNTLDVSVMSYCVSGTLIKHDLETIMSYYSGNAQKCTGLKDLYLKISEKLTPKTKKLFYEIENNLPKVLAKMELLGIKIDISKLNELEDYFSSKKNEIAKEIYKIAGEEFNIASQKQVGKILYEKCKFKNSGQKFHTDSETLMTFAGKNHGLASRILDWRGYSKLLNGYVKPLIKLTDNNSKVHTTYSQTAVSTGRLSSSEPNLQNIPIRTAEGLKIRSAFIASEGCKLVSFDYSQMELRILAHMSNCRRLKEAFINGLDIHNATASHIFHIPENKISLEQRRLAKIINFSVIYGMTVNGMSRKYGMSKKRVHELFSRFKRLYPEIFQYMHNLEIYAERHGYVETILGRKCYTPTINSINPRMVSFAKRQAINSPIQGSNADIIKMAMIELDKRDIKMLLQIHDELVIEIPNELVEEKISIIKSIMENIITLSVPLVVDIKIGTHL